MRSDASRGINDSTMNAAAAELERNFVNRKHTHTHTHTHTRLKAIFRDYLGELVPER